MGEARGRRGIACAAKRALDVAGALAGLVVLSPVLAAVAIAVAIVDGRPVLFRQVRPGRNAVPITILKFRTMRPLGAGDVLYAGDHLRVTRLGRILRATSLDELPELWNVLRGDMSLVGPRPLLVEYLPIYTPEQRRRHDVPPGITGWAAVNGRHVLRFEERLRLDVWYVDHWSLWLDLRILALTLLQVVRRSDVAVTQDIDGIGFPLPAAGGAAPGRARAAEGAEAPPAPHGLPE